MDRLLAGGVLPAAAGRPSARGHCGCGGSVAQVRGLDEKIDTEFNPDFSAKSPNFKGLVLFCIEADFCTEIRILQQ